jgi:hypothetical protein
MAKPKADDGMTVSLFPFMSILACLIGALVVMIVVQSINQSSQTEGRTEEDIKRAKEFLELEKELAQDNATLEELEAKIEESQAVEEELEETRNRNVLLKGNLNISEFDKEEKSRKAAELQQILENLTADLEIWKHTKPKLDARIKELEAKLKELNKKPDDTPPPVVVVPSGSGAEQGTSFFFAEASGSGIKVLRSFDEAMNVTDIIRVNTGAIGVNEDLNTWLDEVANIDKSQIIVLVRDGGHHSSNQLRNYSMHPDHPFQVPVSRLPMPGSGDADLKAFKALAGKLPPRAKPQKPPAPAKPK